MKLTFEQLKTSDQSTDYSEDLTSFSSAGHKNDAKPN